MRRILLISVLATTSLAGCGRFVQEPAPVPVSIRSVLERSSAPIATPSSPPSSPVASPVPTPAPATSINLDVPFYPQAPDADWSLPWQEACEEASVLLVANAYFEHQWTKEAFKREILALVAWEVERFGAYEHTDAAQTAEMLSDYLGLETRMHEDPTLADVQEALQQGHLLVGLFAGRELGNPFYSGEGPVYHAMVLKGYTADGMIVTNDVGTKRGADYLYPWAVLRGALHEYAVPITAGRAMLLEVLPPQ